MTATPPPETSSPRWAWALCLLALVPALPLLVGRRLVIQHDIFISDLLHSQLPYKAFLGKNLAAGHLPLWMPDVFSGIPFLASVEAGPLFPPHLLLFGLLDPYTALGVCLALEILAAAFGAWWLARRLGAGPLPAVLAGISYAWSGFMVTHGRHLNMHAAAALLPWVLLALERLLGSGGRRGGVLLAGLVALAVLAGHPQILFITCLLMGARLLAHWVRRDWGTAWRDRLREGVAFSAATGLGLGLAAPQLLPTWAFSQASLGQVAPTWAYAAAYPCPPRDLLALVWPPLVGAMETYDYASQGASTIAWGNYGYGGIVALVLLPLALVGVRRRTTWFWAGALVVSLLLVLGPHTPLYHLAWSLLPGMKLFRFPTRFLVVSGLALALLGALGFEALWARLARRLAPRTLLALGVLLLAAAQLDLGHHQLPRLPTDEAAAWRSAPGPRGIVAGDPDARVLVLQEFDLWERAFHRARGFLDGPEAYRSGWSLPLGSAGLMHGLRSASGYARMVHWRAAASWQEYNRDLLPHAARPRRPSAEDGGVTPAFQAQLDRAGVRWVLSPFSLSGGALVPMERDGLLQYRNPGALPRAYIASRWQVAADYGAAEAWLLGEGAETPAIPVIESASAPDPATGGALLPVTVEERGSDRLRLRLPAAAPAGMLVVADTWDAGWQAEVDGVPAPVLVANGYQRAVALPAGAREVTFRYWPEGLSAGLWASLGSLLALAGWAISGRLAARGERAR